MDRVFSAVIKSTLDFTSHLKCLNFFGGIVTESGFFYHDIVPWNVINSSVIMFVSSVTCGLKTHLNILTLSLIICSELSDVKLKTC